MVATKRLSLVMETEEKKRSKAREDGSYHTAQIGHGDRGRKESKKWIGYDLDLISIEFGV